MVERPKLDGFGRDSEEDEKLLSIVRSAIYQAHHRKFYKADAVVGLAEAFMACAHLMVPEDEINNLYSWLLNLQILDEEFKNRLRVSKKYDENDIFVFSIPNGSIQIILKDWYILILSTIVSLFWV